MLLLLPLLLLVLLLLLAASASAAARGGAISLLACAETRVLALCSPEIELAFCFRMGFGGVFCNKTQNSRRAALYKNMLSSPFRIVFVRCFPVCVCVCRISYRSLQYFADSRLSAHAGFDLHLSFSSVRPGGGGEGGRGDDVHANATCVFCFFSCVTSRTLPVAL